MATGIVAQVQKSATDFVPEVFGRLTTIGPPHKVLCGARSTTFYKVLCECGAEKNVRRGDLTSGKTVSCGCYKAERGKEVHTTHGHSGYGKTSPEYQAYRNMLTRCNNTKATKYKDYGGRGISVFPEWDCSGGFERWLAHIGPRPSIRHSQDREDVEGNYEPGNVRWATVEEQANNRRNNVWITHEDKTMSIAQWSDLTGIDRKTIHYRHTKGMPTSEIFSTVGFMGTQLTYRGETKTLKQWADATGINRTTLKSRLDLGWEIADVLTVPAKRGNRKPTKPKI